MAPGRRQFLTAAAAKLLIGTSALGHFNLFENFCHFSFPPFGLEEGPGCRARSLCLIEVGVLLCRLL